MALSTSTTARWTILSSSAAMPSGRCRPSAFGMYTLRDGFARYAPRWTRACRSPKVRFEILPVLLPRHAVDPRRRLRLQRAVGRPQAIDVDVVQQRGEPHFLVLPCDSAHTIQRTWRARSGSVSGARFAGPRSPWPGPFPPPPPPPAARRCSAASPVLRARPTSHGRASRDCGLGLPRATRPAITTAGGHGISRFSRTEIPRMHRVSDRAGSASSSR